MRNITTAILMLVISASPVAGQFDRMEFSDESPTNTIPTEDELGVIPGFIPLFALPGTEVELNLEAAYEPSTGRQVVRERFDTTIADGEVFAGREMRLLFIDFNRFAYSTLQLQGTLEADFPRARAFVNRTPVGPRTTDDQLRARILDIYSSHLDSLSAALMLRQGFKNSSDPEPQSPRRRQVCSMEAAYALQSRDIINIVVAETFSQVNASEGGNWRHRGYCDPRKNIQVRIPGSNIVIFRTNWYGRCDRSNDRVGSVVRSAARGDYVNNDFPLLRIFNTVYPEQNVYARHLLQININPGTGGLQLNSSYAHWGDGNPSVISAYLLQAHEAHFRSFRVCR